VQQDNIPYLTCCRFKLSFVFLDKVNVRALCINRNRTKILGALFIILILKKIRGPLLSQNPLSFTLLYNTNYKVHYLIFEVCKIHHLIFEVPYFWGLCAVGHWTQNCPCVPKDRNGFPTLDID
jgi:hypothetical protein